MSNLETQARVETSIGSNSHLLDLFARRELVLARIEGARRELRRAEADYHSEHSWRIAKGRKLAELEARQSSIIGAVDALTVLDGEIHWALNAEGAQ